MIQIAIILIGFMGISHMMSTPEQREEARLSVKRLEPYCLAIIIGVVGTLAYSYYFE